MESRHSLIHNASSFPLVRLRCCSLIASASAAAPRAIASIHFNCHAAELPACIRFSCRSPLAFASAAALDCQLHCFPIASASATAPRLCPLQLCSPMASASSAAPRLQLLLPDCVRFGCCSPPAVLEDSSHVHYSQRFCAEFEVRSTKVACHYSVVPPHEHPTSITHRQTNRHTHG